MNVRQMAEVCLELLLQWSVARDNKTNMRMRRQPFGGFEDEMKRLLGADVSGVEHNEYVIAEAKFTAE